MLIRNCTVKDIGNLVSLYQACFAEPPWCEVFDRIELTTQFEEFISWQDAVFLVADDGDGAIVGGTLGYHQERKKDVGSVISHDWRNSFYLAELFVSKQRRLQGVAKHLIAARFDAARKKGFTSAVVRTSTDQPIIRRLYENIGYSVIASQEVLSSKSVDGFQSLQKDSRVILGGIIP
ncbi:MAG: GNAT family N-acetyltransferase [Patescibacteria group bacterium]|nr:GNAT family N-acetyltransferase [Patescibacteria group bacterium]